MADAVLNPTRTQSDSQISRTTSYPTKSLGINHELSDIISKSVGKNASYLNQLGHLPPSQRNAAKAQTAQLSEILRHSTRIMQQRTGGQIPTDPAVRNELIESSVQDAAHYIKTANPLIEPVLNKDTVAEITQAIQAEAIDESKTTQEFPTQLNESLSHPRWQGYFSDEAEKQELIQKISDEISHQSVRHPDKTAREIISHKLQSHVYSKPQIASATDANDLHAMVEETSRVVETHALAHQDSIFAQKQGTIPAPRGSIDAWYALGQTSSPLVGASGNYATRNRLHESYAGIHKKLDEDMADALVGELPQGFGGNKLDYLRQNLSMEALMLFKQGYRAGDVQRFRDNIEHGRIAKLGGSKQKGLATLRKHEQQLALLESFLEYGDNRQSLSRLTRFQSKVNQAPRLLGRFDVFGLRHQIPFGIDRYRRAKDKFLEPVHKLAKPLFWAGDLAAAPFDVAAELRSKATRKVKHWVGRKMFSLGVSMTAKAAASAGAKKVLLKIGGKALLKLGGAALGIGTGGVGTAVMLLSLAKDLWQNRHLLVNLFKKFFFYGLAAITAMMALFYTFLAKFLPAIIAFGIGTAIGGPILGAVAAAATYFITSGGLATAWGGITSAVASAISVVGTWWASISASASVAATTAGVAAAATIGGIAAGGALDTIRLNEIYTIRFDQGWDTIPVVPIDGICWPTTGEITQGPNPMHRTTGNSGQAIDIANGVGTPVYAVLGGIARSDVHDDGYGIHVEIISPEGTLIYAHLDQTSIPRRPGSVTVQQNQVIGEMGATGGDWGSHLHYESLHGTQIAQYIPPSPPLNLGEVITNDNRCILFEDIIDEDATDGASENQEDVNAFPET